jgi:hypothetical protein
MYKTLVINVLGVLALGYCYLFFSGKTIKPAMVNKEMTKTNEVISPR